MKCQHRCLCIAKIVALTSFSTKYLSTIFSDSFNSSIFLQFPVRTDAGGGREEVGVIVKASATLLMLDRAAVIQCFTESIRLWRWESKLMFSRQADARPRCLQTVTGSSEIPVRGTRSPQGWSGKCLTIVGNWCSLPRLCTALAKWCSTTSKLRRPLSTRLASPSEDRLGQFLSGCGNAQIDWASMRTLPTTTTPENETMMRSRCWNVFNAVERDLNEEQIESC